MEWAKGKWNAISAQLRVENFDMVQRWQRLIEEDPTYFKLRNVAQSVWLEQNFQAKTKKRSRERASAVDGGY